MEYNINNNPGFDELQAQYDILKRKFDAQQIVNHDLVHQVAKTKMAKIQRKLHSSLLFSVFIFAFSWVWVTFRVDCSIAFSLAYLALSLFIIIRWLVVYRKVLRSTPTSEDLLAAAQSYKASFNVKTVRRIIGLLVSVVFLVWFLLEFEHISLAEFDWRFIDMPFVVGIATGIVFGLIASIRQKKKDTAVCDEVIRSLTEE